jgi:SAM-dependent methyltransferase
MTRNVAPNKDALHPFDLQHGTDTGGYLGPHEIVTGHAHDEFGFGYSSIAPSVFREIIRRWRATLPDPERGPAAYSFVDVGAGKGRALLLASEVAFRKVIGVELSAELARIAQRNVECWPRSEPRIHVMAKDVMDFCWPRTSLLVYLYNPFACELIESLLERLETVAKRSYARAEVVSACPPPGAAEACADCPGERPSDGTPCSSHAASAASGEGCATEQRRESSAEPMARPSARIDLLYANPTCADVVSRRGSWTLLWTDRIDMDEADQAADPYGTTFDRVSCYRLRG